MSGGGSIGGSGGGGREPISCETLFVKTALNSPNPEVLLQLREGAVLSIEVRGRLLVAVTASGEIAGSITSTMMAKILECIKQGYSYVAIVKKISGGHCDVEIRPRTK